VGNLIDKIPEILEKSGNLFSLFALVVLAVAILSYLFYRKADSGGKNRAFLLILLFFFGLVLAALAAGTLSGFQRGSEATTVQVIDNPETIDPSLIKLSPGSIRSLENYLLSKGEEVTGESKIRVLEKALENYINPTPTPISSDPTPTTPTSATHEIAVAQQTAEENGFRFSLQNCERSSEAVTCNFMITNIGNKDEGLRLYGSDSWYGSRVFDLSGNEYLAVAAQMAGLFHSN
jgi:hypothetical protein